MNQNPLDWWQQNERQLPILAELARYTLGIPATSVPSERVFSTAGDIVNANRSALKWKNVDMMLFLKKNM